MVVSAGLVARRSAQLAVFVFVVSVAVYEKPASFYTNFVMLPSLFSFLFGAALVLVTIIAALVAVVQRKASRQELVSVGLGAGAMVLALLIIMWRAS